MTHPGGRPGDGYTVPPVLRSARFVPRQGPGRRQPAKVTSGAFRAIGLAVPENIAQQNAYQLSRRQGFAWDRIIDRHVSRQGAELLGHGALIQVDIDFPANPDGTGALNTLRWLSDRATEAGEFLDVEAALSVRTPGHPDRGHLPGWHLWFAADPGLTFRMGPMTRCKHVEIRTRGTCPGSPGYAIHSAPAALPVLPRWIAALAFPPPVQAVLREGASGADPARRLEGIIYRLLGAGEGERNHVLYWAAARVAEVVACGALERSAAEKLLTDAAGELGLLAEDGGHAVAATIASGFRQAVPA